MKKPIGFIIEGIFKNLLIVLMAFFLMVVLFLYMAKPVVKAPGLLFYMHADFIQEMMAAELSGMDVDTAFNFIRQIEAKSSFHSATLIPLQDVSSDMIEQQLSLELSSYEIESLMNFNSIVVTDRRLSHDRDSGRHKADYLRRRKRLQEIQPPSLFDPRFLRMWFGTGGPREAGRTDGLVPENTHRPATVDVQNGTSRRTGVIMYRKTSERPIQYLMMPLKSCGQLLVLQYSQSGSLIAGRHRVLLGAALSLLLMMLVTASLVAHMVIRLQRYEKICERVAGGDLKARCNDLRRDILGSLSRHIDAMTEANLNHLEQQKSLLQAVAHEMRTPLSRIHFSLEMLDIPEDDTMRQNRLASIDEDLNEVNSLIKELTYFNYVDAGNGKQHFEENDVRHLVDLAVAKCAPALQKFSLTIDIPDGELVLNADATAFRRVINNLLGNAMRYAKEKICIRIRCCDTLLELAVEDDGPGIPVESRKKVLEPFVSVDQSRNKALSGVGLGLAIVDRIMKVHSGAISIEDSDEFGGCRMVTRWPFKHDQ